MRAAHQRQGVGRELIRRTLEGSGQAALILLAVPKAADYSPESRFPAASLGVDAAK